MRIVKILLSRLNLLQVDACRVTASPFENLRKVARGRSNCVKMSPNRHYLCFIRCRMKRNPPVSTQIFCLIMPSQIFLGWDVELVRWRPDRFAVEAVVIFAIFEFFFDFAAYFDV